MSWPCLHNILNTFFFPLLYFICRFLIFSHEVNHSISCWINIYMVVRMVVVWELFWSGLINYFCFRNWSNWLFSKSIFGTLDSNYDKTNEITQLDAIRFLHSDVTSVNELDADRLVKLIHAFCSYATFECNEKIKGFWRSFCILDISKHH